jgi:hypothetical protein
MASACGAPEKKKIFVYISNEFCVRKGGIRMGKACDLCDAGPCQNKKVHLSRQAADIAYCNVVRASKYAENCKADVKAGREVEDELEYGAFDMEEGEAKEIAKAEGVALAARLAAAREAGFAVAEKKKVARFRERHVQQLDAELLGTMKEHDEGEAGAGCESREDLDPETVEKARKRMQLRIHGR